MTKEIRVVVLGSQEGDILKINSALRGQGNISCLCFETATQTLRHLSVIPSEVVLAKIPLPKICYKVFFKEIKRRAPRTKLIAVSEVPDRPMFLESLRAGADGYLVSPIPVDRCLQAIYDVLNGGTPLSANVTNHLLQLLRVRSPLAAEPRAYLTSREEEILFHVANGLSDKEIGGVLQISTFTVSTHLHNIYEKLQVTNRIEALNRIREFEPGARQCGPWRT